MKEEQFYEKTYFVIGTCSFHGSDVPRRMRRRWNHNGNHSGGRRW